MATSTTIPNQILSRWGSRHISFIDTHTIEERKSLAAVTRNLGQQIHLATDSLEVVRELTRNPKLEPLVISIVATRAIKSERQRDWHDIIDAILKHPNTSDAAKEKLGPIAIELDDSKQSRNRMLAALLRLDFVGRLRGRRNENGSTQ